MAVSSAYKSMGYDCRMHLGNGNRAYQYYTEILPQGAIMMLEILEVEPYVIVRMFSERNIPIWNGQKFMAYWYGCLEYGCSKPVYIGNKARV